MQIDRRELLIGAASSAALLALSCDAAEASRVEPELFAAARKDDRGAYSAALFSLNDGDIRSVELPERGHDIALRPGSAEWVAFARRPGRFGVAVPTDGRPPVWFRSPQGIRPSTDQLASRSPGTFSVPRTRALTSR